VDGFRHADFRAGAQQFADFRNFRHTDQAAARRDAIDNARDADDPGWRRQRRQHIEPRFDPHAWYNQSRHSNFPQYEWCG
jgi:hypothetical protein